MNNLEFRVPKNEDEFYEYDLFRWRLLRKPIGKTIESLKDDALQAQIDFIDWKYLMKNIKNFI